MVRPGLASSNGWPEVSTNPGRNISATDPLTMSAKNKQKL